MSQLPNDPNSRVPIEDRALGQDAVIDLLSEDDDNAKEPETRLEKPEENSNEDGKKKEEVSQEIEEGEEELTLEDELELELGEEVDEDKLELVELPSRREILAAYPDLFKKFPGIEKSMYREKAYSELLPTIHDAQLAVDKAELLDKYDTEIANGSTESLLTTIKETDKEAFAKLVDNYMPNLYKVDQTAYYHTISNVLKHTIISMMKDAREQNREELSGAAAELNHYLFGTDKFTPPTNLSQDEVTTEVKKRDQEIDRREIAAVERQFNSAREDLSTRVDTILLNSVGKSIDPNDSMSGYVKDAAADKVLVGLENLIARDTRFRIIYDKLWERAFENDFDKESMDRIKKAYLSKAQTLLPLLIKKERNEALKGSRRANDEKDRKGPLPVGKTRSSTTLASGKPNGSNGNKSVPKGMSTLDYLNSDD